MALVSDHDDVLDYGLTGHFRTRDGVFASFFRWLARTSRASAHRRAVYRTQRALDAVSDRTLHDIGLTRGSILSAATSAADREFGHPHPDERPR